MSEASKSKKNKVQDKSAEPSVDESTKGHSSGAQGSAPASAGDADGPVTVKLAGKADAGPKPEHETEAEATPAAGSTPDSESSAPEGALPTDKTKALGAPARVTKAAAVAVAVPRDMYRGTGLLVVAGGFAVAAAPLVSAQVAEALAPLGSVQVPAGTMIVGGLVLFGIGVLRRTLHAIRGEVECITNETLLIGQIADDNRELQREFDGFGHEVASARMDMGELQEKVERLTEVATDPAFETSIFRLAASLDQLGARLDVAMKERFGELRGRLEAVLTKSEKSTEEVSSGLEKLDEHLERIDASAAGVRERVEHGNQALEGFGEELGKLEKSLVEDLRGQLEAVSEQLANFVEASSARADDRLDKSVHSMEQLGAEIVRLEETFAQDVGRQLGELRGQLESTLEAASTRVDEQLEKGAHSMSHLEEHLGTELGRLEGSFTQDVGRQLGELRDQIESTVQASSTRVDEQLAKGVHSMEHLGEHLGEQMGEHLGAELGRLEQSFAQNVERQLGEVRGQLEGAVESSSARSGDRLDQCARAISSLEEELDRVRSALGEGVAGLSAESGQVAEQLVSGLEELHRELVGTVEGQRAALDERLGGLEREFSERSAALREREEVIDAHAELRNVELGEQLDRLGDQFEQAIGQRCDSLANDLMAVVEIAGESAADVRHLIESAGSVVEPESHPELAAATDTAARGSIAPEGAGESASLPFGHDVSSVVGANGESSVPQAALPQRDEPRADRSEAQESQHEGFGHESKDGWTTNW